MKTCSCTFPHHDAALCEKCNYFCDEGNVIHWPMPDLTKWSIEIDDDLVVFRRKKK